MRKLKKVVSLLLVMCMVFTTAAPAFASERVQLNMRQLGSYFKNHHNVIGWGAYDGTITVFQVGSEYAFCTQAGVGIRDSSGNQWTPGTPSFVGDYNISTVAKDNSTQTKIAYLGFLQHQDNPAIWNDQVTRDWYYAMTQMMIWQTLPAENITANGMTNGQYNSYFLNSSMAGEYESFKQRIQAKINTWATKPSFNYKTIDITSGDSVYVNDSNGVLEDYNSFTYTKNGITVSHTKGSNTMTATADSNCSQRNVAMLQSELKTVGAQKYSAQTKATYLYDAGNSQDLAVYGNVGDPIDLSFSFNVDITTGKIAIEKTKAPDAASDKATPEQGAEFQIYLKSAGSYAAAPAEYRDIITTGADGKAMTKDLPHETYTVHQTKGAAGHVLSKDFDVVISPDQPDKVYTYSLVNETLKSKIQIVKKDLETGKVIPRAGAAYELTNVSTGKQIIGPGEKGYFVTDESGYINIDNHLYFGRYLLTERKAPEGYVLGAPVEFNVDGTKETVIVEQFDKAQKGRINITKTGDILSSIKESGGVYTPVYKNSPLDGVTFQIKAAENITTPDGTVRAKKGDVVDAVTTGSSGTAQSKELYLGKYDIIETKTVPGFVLENETKTVELKYKGQEIEITDEAVSLTNERQKVKIDLEKEIESDNTFGYDAEDAYSKVNFGLFADKEIKAADGSKIPKDGMIETIGLTKTETKGQYTAGFKTDIPNGMYYVKETKTPAGYIISDSKYPVDFTYTSGNVATVKISINNGKPIENKIIRGNITGRKVTDDGNNLGGALIGLFRSDETSFTEKTAILKTTTADNGSFSFLNVPFGKYIIKEIKAPAGCVLNTKKFDIEVKEHNQEIEITMENLLQRGVIKIHKTGDILYHIEKKEDEYTPKFKEGGIAGAVFEVRAAEDIITPDKVLRVKKGEVVDTITTDDKGEAKTKKLFIGKYTVQEIKAPYGHVIDPKIYETELKYMGQEEDVTGAELSLTNTRQKVVISLDKFIEEDDVFGIKAEDIYKDIKFGIFADEEITATDGTKIPKGGKVEVIGVKEAEESEAESGKLYFGRFTKDLPNGMYYVTETATNEQYILDDTKYPVDFTYKDQTIETAIIDAGMGEDIDNELLRGEVMGYKTGDKDKPLEGAVFGLFRSDEKDFTEANTLKTTKTDENGLFKFTGIPFGDWIVHEIAAPWGYLLSDESHEVSIREDMEVIELTASNAPKIGRMAFEHHAGMMDERVYMPAKTGDERDLWPYALMAVVALLGALAAVRLKKGEELDNSRN